MVNLPTVRAHNESLKSLGPGLVAVFVGGTSGISLSTALALARHSTSPRIYLIGRSQSAADNAIERIKTLNPNAQPTFLKADISLLKGVDSVCDEIKKREKYLNLLFMTPGYLTLSGRDETSEGMDRKLVLHYYARMRFISNLQPLLSNATSPEPAGDGKVPTPSLSRVVSVLDPWTPAVNGGQLNYNDLSLKHNFSLRTCGLHASMMGNFYLETMARRYTGTTFIHAFPSGVDTGVLRDFPGAKVIMPIARVLLKPWMVPIEESGERHLFAATNPRYPSLDAGEEGKGKRDTAVGSNGNKGSGCYWLNWDGEPFSSHKKFEKVRGEDGVERIVKHTEEVFGRICGEGKTYP